MPRARQTVLQRDLRQVIVRLAHQKRFTKAELKTIDYAQAVLAALLKTEGYKEENEDG